MSQKAPSRATIPGHPLHIVHSRFTCVFCVFCRLTLKFCCWLKLFCSHQSLKEAVFIIFKPSFHNRSTLTHLSSDIKQHTKACDKRYYRETLKQSVMQALFHQPGVFCCQTHLNCLLFLMWLAVA